mgnify:FL=1
MSEIDRAAFRQYRKNDVPPSNQAPILRRYFMRRVIFALSVAVPVAAGAITPAAAQDYPYCLQGKDYGLPGLCHYWTYQQCLASASGTFSY